MAEEIQHGIDDNPHNDPEKARVGGGIAGAVTGGVAGSVVGPLGTLGGAIVGGVVAAFASEAAVKEVDKVDNDDTISGLGEGATTIDKDHLLYEAGKAIGQTYETAKEKISEGYHGAVGDSEK